MALCAEHKIHSHHFCMGKYRTIVYLPLYLQEFEVTGFCSDLLLNHCRVPRYTDVGIIHITYRVVVVNTLL